MATKRPDTSTGNTREQTILASAAEPTGAVGTPAPAKSASASIRPAEALSLVQADLFDLQKLGAKIAIKTLDGALYIGIIMPGHALGYQDGHITLDGVPVVKG